MRKSRPYRQTLLEALADPVEASAYLNAALDDSPQAFLKAASNDGHPVPSDSGLFRRDSGGFTPTVASFG